MSEEPPVVTDEPKKKRKIWMVILLTFLGLILAAGVSLFLFARDKYNRLGKQEETFDRSDVYVNTTAATTHEETETETETETEPSTEASAESSTEKEKVKVKKTTEAVTTEKETEKAVTEKYTTLMLYGVDARNNTDLEKDANADSAIVCVIDNETYEVTLVSVLRDILVETPTGYRTKLTDVYAGYGVKESLGTINKCLDLEITQYATVNWTAVATAVNALGGIDVELTKAEIDYINYNNEGMGRRVGIPSDPIEYVGDGLYHINGVHAVMHAANRTIGQHDISRAERQRTILKAMLKQAKSCSLTQLNNCINAVLPYVSTNLTMSEIVSMVVKVPKYEITQNSMFPFTYVNESNLTTAYVYCDTLPSNVIELHRLLYGIEGYVPNDMVYQVDEFIQNYRAEHP